MNSWLIISEQSDFSIHNLPFGSFSTPYRDQRLGVAIGDYIVDLKACAQKGLLHQAPFSVHALEEPILNKWMGCGKDARVWLRHWLQYQLTHADSELHAHQDQLLLPIDSAHLHLPVEIGDYTDFYSSEDHARNVGKMFRDPENALLPNWKHLPVGYHGRASSIVVSGTNIHRPKVQFLPAGSDVPSFGPSKMIDFELEMAFIVAENTELGSHITTDQAEDAIFGVVIFNDWSARDKQRWEYVPLGPFLAKNFGSVASPWVVTLEALDAFRVAGPIQEPKVLPYLEYKQDMHFDVNLEVYLQPDRGAEELISKSNFKYMYWNMAQQLAHHTINGCNVRIGDMMASGTISGPTPDSFGSMLELAWGGKNPITLKDGSTRTSIQDGDTVIMRGYAEKNGIRIGFGECRSKILPSI
jgi:fumarylacetoacetase